MSSDGVEGGKFISIKCPTMFIKEIKKKNQGYDKEFITHRLVESYRTGKEPRQRTILNLGKLDLPKEQWKWLADQIEAEITGQKSFYTVAEHIEKLATYYTRLIIEKNLIKSATAAQEQKPEPEYETINLTSISGSESGAAILRFIFFTHQPNLSRSTG